MTEKLVKNSRNGLFRANLGRASADPVRVRTLSGTRNTSQTGLTRPTWCSGEQDNGVNTVSVQGQSCLPACSGERDDGASPVYLFIRVILKSDFKKIYKISTGPVPRSGFQG